MGINQSDNNRLSGVWLVALIVLGIFILGDLNRRMGDARRLERDAQFLETQVASLEEETKLLQTQVAGASGEVLVEAWAHGEAKMVREGETLVIPLAPPGATPTVLPSFEQPPERPSPWEVWVALIFGG